MIRKESKKPTRSGCGQPFEQNTPKARTYILRRLALRKAEERRCIPVSSGWLSSLGMRDQRAEDVSRASVSSSLKTQTLYTAAARNLTLPLVTKRDHRSRVGYYALADKHVAQWPPTVGQGRSIMRSMKVTGKAIRSCNGAAVSRGDRGWGE